LAITLAASSLLAAGASLRAGNPESNTDASLGKGEVFYDLTTPSAEQAIEGGKGDRVGNVFATFDHTHGRYGCVLSNFVTNGRVDYARLQAAPQELDAYLNELAAVNPGQFAAWSREDRLALLLNLYNAWTLRLIIDHYPLKSIRDIGTLPAPPG